jgi:DNA polymerase-1
VDQHYGVFEGTTFKHDRFDTFLRINGIPWPRHDSGKLKLDSDTFKDRTRANPQLTALRELRASLSELRLEKLAVGADGRNRVNLWPFSASTGRNAPSTNQFVFGPARWIRGLVKPGPGNALAYLDWSSQEIAIAAVLSGDRALLRAALSDDPYLMFAKLAGLAPDDATSKTHKRVRSLCKVCLLGSNYGMGVAKLAQDAGVSLIQAEAIRRALSKTFPVFWQWAEHMTDVGMLTGELHTVFGWPLHVTATTKATTVRNFSMQANGAEMLGIACSLATERGVTVCAPIHDALLIEAPADDLDHAVAQTRAAMSEASRVVLDGVTIAVGVDAVTWPGRYMDEDGEAMWHRIMGLLQRQRLAA